MRKLVPLCLAVLIGAGLAVLPTAPALAHNRLHTVTIDVTMKITDHDWGPDEHGTRKFSRTALVNDDSPSVMVEGRGCVDHEVAVELELTVKHSPKGQPAGSVSVNAWARLLEGSDCWGGWGGVASDYIYVGPGKTATGSFWIHKVGPGKDRAKITYTATNSTS
jgi:hypothetical protein